jgi:hypothetical protein
MKGKYSIRRLKIEHELQKKTFSEVEVHNRMKLFSLLKGKYYQFELLL